MKNTITRVLALAVAVLVLCAPVGAMADSYDTITLTLSDFAMQYGSMTVNLDTALKLDIGMSEENGNVAGALTILSGGAEAIRGGLNFDGENLTAGVDGMTKSVLLPMTELLAELEDSLTGSLDSEEMQQVAAIVESYMNIMAYISDEEKAMAYGEAVIELFEQYISLTDQGETTLDLGDLGSYTVEQYDYSITMAEFMSLFNDMVNADPELATLYQAYFDALSDIAGEDISAMLNDPSLFEDIDMTISGSFYFNEEGAVLMSMDITATEDDETVTIPFEMVCLPGESSELIRFYMQVDDYGDLTDITFEANVPYDDSPVFDMTLYLDQYYEGDYEPEHIVISLISDGDEDNADVTLYVEMYDDADAENYIAMGLRYIGTTVEDESGISFPGTLMLYANEYGEEVSASMNINVQLHTMDEIYTVSGEPVDITTATEEDMNALLEDLMNAVGGGLSKVMGDIGGVMESLT